MRIFDGARKNIGKTVVQHVGRIYADRDEGQQFDHGFEGDCGNQAFVTLGGVEMARAEQDGEYRQQQRDIKSIVGEQRYRGLAVGRGDGRVLEDDGKTVGNGFQLQRDVGHDADHRDNRHEAAQQLAFAVARRHEVGD